MQRGAATPEELEMLFEDASILRDRTALTDLFTDEAVFGMVGDRREERGAEAIVGRIDRLWRTGHIHVADVHRVFQSEQIALAVGHAINVSRRCHDGAWRYVICMPGFETPHTKETRP